MSSYDDREIQDIIARVRTRLGGTPDRMPEHPRVPTPIPDVDLGEGMFATIDEAVEAADRAYAEYTARGSEIRSAMRADVPRTAASRTERCPEVTRWTCDSCAVS